MEWILKMQICDGKQDFVNAEKILIVLFRRPHSFAIEYIYLNGTRFFSDFVKKEQKKLTRLKKEILT